MSTRHSSSHPESETSSPRTPGPGETRARRYTVAADAAPGRPVETLLEIKRSEFIGLLARVETEEEARAFVEAQRKRYHDARHVCSAFVLGADRDVQRSSDDGEPAGTAGIPMLQAVLSHRTGGEDEDLTDLSDVCAVVVRYFGGIKLGAGGLVRAYTDAVVRTLDAAQLVPRSRLRLGSVAVDHAQAGRLENELRTAGLTVLGTDYGARATLHLAVEDSERALNRAVEQLAALTAGTSTIDWAGTDWVDGS